MVDSIVRLLPLEGAAIQQSGVYFETPLKMDTYWPLERALCIFFKDKRPYDQVNLIGQGSSRSG
ncbi:MAG: hypothetical protein QXR84_00615 [Candidatus Bathyarchaeia archaeon]